MISSKLLIGIRNVIGRLENEERFEWGHMGFCNCGHLAAELLQMDPHQIQRIGVQTEGDWTCKLTDYCPDTGRDFDMIVGALLREGLTRHDLMNLEYLKDPNVLGALKREEKYLSHSNRADAILYFKTWLALLEEKFAEQVNIPQEGEPLAPAVIEQA